MTEAGKKMTAVSWGAYPHCISVHREAKVFLEKLEPKITRPGRVCMESGEAADCVFSFRFIF